MRRHYLFAALAAAAVFVLAAMFILAVLKIWEHNLDPEAWIRPEIRIVRQMACFIPVESIIEEGKCHEKELDFAIVSWCRPTPKQDVPFDGFVTRRGRPAKNFLENKTFVDRGPRDWSIGFYKNSSTGWRLPTIRHPVSTVAWCSEGRFQRSPKSHDEVFSGAFMPHHDVNWEGKLGGRVVYMETQYLPDPRGEMNVIVAILVIGGVIYGSRLHAIWRSTKHRRHTMRNVLQRLRNQLHEVFEGMEDEDARSRAADVAEGCLRDGLLVLDQRGEYREGDLVRLGLVHLLGDLIGGVQDGKIATKLECPLDIVVECWEDPLRSALENLIQNAAKSARKGKAEERWIRVRVDSERADAVRIVVENGGECFPREALKKFASRYWFWKSKGLGLVIAREVVHRHGGRIALRNARSRGGPVAQAEVLLPYMHERRKARVERWWSAILRWRWSARRLFRRRR